jgi:fatty acid desaturase
MRLPGISEIILILIVATAVIFAVRIMGAPRRTGDNTARYRDAEEEERRYEERVRQTRRSRIQLAGVVAILAGVVIFLSSLNLIKWVFWGPVGALVIIVIGIITIYAARRR